MLWTAPGKPAYTALYAFHRIIQTVQSAAIMAAHCLALLPLASDRSSTEISECRESCVLAKLSVAWEISVRTATPEIIFEWCAHSILKQATNLYKFLRLCSRVLHDCFNI